MISILTHWGPRGQIFVLFNKLIKINGLEFVASTGFTGTMRVVNINFHSLRVLLLDKRIFY